MTLFLQGVLAGAAHVLTGPDHLAGVAPLAVGPRRRIRPSMVGARWGLGHGIGVAIVGVLAQTVLTLTEVEVASGWAERLVGVVLIVIGALAIRRSRAIVVHEHEHTHDDGAHVHLHVHGPDHHGADQHGHDERVEAHDGRRPQHEHSHGRAAFGVGVLHGLAGAGHFWAVIPSLAMTPPDAAIYIASYLAATVAIMTLFGALIGRLTSRFGDAAVPRLMVGVGALSIAIGAWWLVVN